MDLSTVALLLCVHMAVFSVLPQVCGGKLLGSLRGRISLGVIEPGQFRATVFFKITMHWLEVMVGMLMCEMVIKFKVRNQSLL